MKYIGLTIQTYCYIVVLVVPLVPRMEKNLLDLPCEIIMECIKKTRSASTQFMFSITCSYAYDMVKSVASKRGTTTHGIKIAALRDGHVEVLEYLLDLGMKIDYHDYVSFINVENLDVILMMRERTWNIIIYHQKTLIKRIVQDSNNVECITYAMFLDIDVYRPRSDIILNFDLLIKLYDHPDELMFEKIGLCDRHEVVKKISYLPSAYKKAIMLRGAGPRLIRDGIKSNLWDLKLEDYYLIAFTFFYDYCDEKIHSLDVVELFFNLGIIDVNCCSRMVTGSIITPNTEALLYCISRKIPFPIHPDDYKFAASLQELKIPYIKVSNYQDKIKISEAYESIPPLMMSTRRFTMITKALINLGMPIPIDIFKRQHTYNVRGGYIHNIDVIEMYISQGAQPCHEVLTHAELYYPSIVPRLLELGFKENE